MVLTYLFGVFLATTISPDSFWLGDMCHLDKWFNYWTLRVLLLNLTYPADEKERCLRRR